MITNITHAGQPLLLWDQGCPECGTKVQAVYAVFTAMDNVTRTAPCQHLVTLSIRPTGITVEPYNFTKEEPL